MRIAPGGTEPPARAAFPPLNKSSNSRRTVPPTPRILCAAGECHMLFDNIWSQPAGEHTPSAGGWLDSELPRMIDRSQEERRRRVEQQGICIYVPGHRDRADSGTANGRDHLDFEFFKRGLASAGQLAKLPRGLAKNAVFMPLLGRQSHAHCTPHERARGADTLGVRATKLVVSRGNTHTGVVGGDVIGWRADVEGARERVTVGSCPQSNKYARGIAPCSPSPS
jgi:hypothetical protein